MATDIYEIQRRSAELAAKTKIESVSPEEVGTLVGDLAAYTNEANLNGSSLGIRKTYASVSAMESDSEPVGDDGQSLKKGMLVNIYNQDDPQNADNGKVFSWQNPGWMLRGKIDAGYVAWDGIMEDLGETTDL